MGEEEIEQIPTDVGFNVSSVCACVWGGGGVGGGLVFKYIQNDGADNVWILVVTDQEFPRC